MGLLYALGAYLSWGLVVPVHFRLLAGVPPGAILSHRIAWSLLLVSALILALRRRLRNPLPLRPRHGLLVLTAGLIGFNWWLYLVAVDTGHLLDASLGYYINPLVNIALGALVLGERLRPLQVAAVGLVGLGVGIVLAVAGSLPLLSLGLALSFALYALLRKLAGVDSMVGFFVETVLLVPAALAYLALAPASPRPIDGPTLALLILAGATTALPLIWFTAAAQRLTMATLGLLQYLAPSCLLMLGVLVYGEPLTAERTVLFGLIWAALALYALDAVRAARERRDGSGRGEIA